MFKKLVMKELLADNDTHIGASVKWYYMFLENVDELYFSKEIKQKFSFFGIPFKVNTSTITMRVPTEISHLFRELIAIDSEAIDSYDLTNYVKDLRASFSGSYDRVYDNLTKNLSGEQLEDMKLRLHRTKRATEGVIQEFLKDELTIIKPFVKDGFVPMYRVQAGSSINLYIGKLIYDRLVLIHIELVSIKDKLHFGNVEQLYLTKTFMKAFDNHIEPEKEVQ